MKPREQEALDIILPKFNQLLDSMDRDQWFSVAIPSIFAFVKQNGLYNQINHGRIRKFLLEEIDRRSPPDLQKTEKTIGLKVKRIEKNNELYTLFTDAGKLTIGGEDLFSQASFRKKVFASLGKFLPAISPRDWDYLISIWASCIQENSADISSEEIIKDALAQFLDDADERDLSYLKRGIPIFHDGFYYFRISDAVKFIRREFDQSLTRPQITAVLNQMGFEKDRNEKRRFWKINAESYDQENNRSARDGQDDDVAFGDSRIGDPMGQNPLREPDERGDQGG